MQTKQIDKGTVKSLKIGDVLVYKKTGEIHLEYFTEGKKYPIKNFYGFGYGVVLENDNNKETLICSENVCVFFNLLGEEKEGKEDNVNHPKHYTWLKELCGIEVIDITRYMDFNLGNVIKYVLRAGHKSEKGMSDKQKELEDLYKAQWYLNDKIDMLAREINKEKKQ